MVIDVMPGLARMDQIVRHEDASESYRQIHDVLTQEAIRRLVARILTHAQPTDQGKSFILRLPQELRKHIVSLLPGGK